MEISTRYNPKETEDKWYSFWEEKGYFRTEVNPNKKPFCIVIPPPNVTGILHMGHALNNTIQDILIRYHRMRSEEALWMPGTDHAGIATQNVVEKEIAKEGLKRQDLGRDKFLERVWQWKEQYGSTIIHQLKKLGASCDWRRMRFTMDDGYSKAVQKAFVDMYNKKVTHHGKKLGLIYRGSYIINWCPRCQTALSDEESPHKEIQGSLYYIKYPLKDSSEYVIVATTRPETMLGDTAVAVNPKDKRYKKLIGKVAILPLIEREMEIIKDDLVDPKFGTGAVKVTPFHDPNDYDIGNRHHLCGVLIMNPDATMNKNAGNYEGLDRFKARESVLEDLKKKGLLVKMEPHEHAVGHCYRCHTMIEPYFSEQWFVRMWLLAKAAIKVVEEGKIKFHPTRWKKVYLNWMHNIKDWCISRQIWWGHRIPAWYCQACYNKYLQTRLSMKLQLPLEISDKEAGIHVGIDRPKMCVHCGSKDFVKDDDVLDTWFSSWLWPFATFGWPFQSSAVSRQSSADKDLIADSRKLKAELGYFYPTSVLVTAPEILFFWVARMIMAGLEFMGDIPFSDVYIHGTVRDIRGKKMSKSLGNAIDPLEIISEYGTDALRFSLTSCASQGDLLLSKEKFEMGRNFANKIWNASRFVLMNLEPDKVKDDLCVFFKKGNIKIFERWILSRFYSMLKNVNRNLKAYRFNEAANLLYAFFWHEFCDWYLEISKNNLKEISTQLITYKILEKSLRVLHPIMPFITEEIWQKLPRAGESIMIQSWPHVEDEIIDKKLESQMELIFQIIRVIRNLRSRIDLKAHQKAGVFIYPHGKNNQQLIRSNLNLIIRLANLGRLDILDSSKRPKDTISEITKAANIYLDFRGLIDVDKEKTKIKENMEKQAQILKTKKVRVRNKDFLRKALPEVVEKEKQSIAEIEGVIERMEQMISELQ